LHQQAYKYKKTKLYYAHFRQSQDRARYNKPVTAEKEGLSVTPTSLVLIYASNPIQEQLMNESSANIKKASGAVTLWGVLTIVLGVFAMGAPLVTGLALAVLIGISLVAAGLMQSIYAFQAGSIGKGVLRLLFGGVTVLAGLTIAGQPGIALATLTLILAIYFVVDGVTTLIASTAVAGGQGKGLIIFNGIVTLVLGIMIWRGWPVSGAWAIGILVGIRLIFSGMTMMALGAVGREVSKQL
jgi:uncharacterized membrane protein HdeD (DUF308 family)